MRWWRPLASAPKLINHCSDRPISCALAKWASRRKRQVANLPHPQGTAKSHQSPSSHGRYILLDNAVADLRRTFFVTAPGDPFTVTALGRARAWKSTQHAEYCRISWRPNPEARELVMQTVAHVDGGDGGDASAGVPLGCPLRSARRDMTSICRTDGALWVSWRKARKASRSQGLRSPAPLPGPLSAGLACDWELCLAGTKAL
jgi:hypothetical protein